MALRIHQPIDPTLSLPEQFRAQAKQLGLDVVTLAQRSGLSLSTVERALGIKREARRPPTPALETALRVADALNLDPVHIAAARTRDLAETLRDDAQDALRRLYDDAVQSLTEHLSWQNPFRPHASEKRLALRRARLGRDLSIDQVAHEDRHHWRLFEQGQAVIPAVAFRRWVERLGRTAVARGGETLDPAAVQSLAEDMAQVHRVNGTTEWRRLRPLPSGEPPRLGEPFVLYPAGVDTTDWSVELGRSPTIFGAIYVEILRARRPSLPSDTTVDGNSTGTGTIVLANARHGGFEVGVLVRGRAALTLKTSPFTEAEARDPAHAAGVTHHRVYQPGDVVAFRSDRHHALTLLDPDAEVVAINLRGNVALARRLAARPPEGRARRPKPLST